MSQHSHRNLTSGMKLSIFVLPALFVFIFFVTQSLFADDNPVDSVLGPPPGQYKILAPDSVIKIPFTLFRGDILLSGGKVNGRDVRMMIDNGVIWDQLLFFGSPLIDSLGLQYDGVVDVGGSGEGNQITSKTASGINISFPGVEFTGQKAIVTPYESGLTNMWEGTEGQVSATFLKHFVVDINFDNMIMTLTEPKKFHYTGKGIETPMVPLEGGSWGIPGIIELVDGRKVSLVMYMDLGYNDYLQIDPRFPNKIEIPDKVIDASLGFGVQGETRGYFGRVKSIQIGRYRLDDVLTAFIAPDDSSQFTTEAMIGLGLFTRFNIIYDYPGHRMFIEPNSHFAEPFEYNMSGFVSKRGKGDVRIISKVYANSPASDAGLVVGDTISLVNGNPIGKIDRFQLDSLFTKLGSQITLTLFRGGKEVPVVLTLRRVI